MNTRLRPLTVSWFFFLFAGISGDVLAQGGLTPPAGAPAPSMKTLDQVEPRVPISAAGFTISQPGSYYLTTNLIATGDGIVIAADGVTLDLMGFSLTGDRSIGDYGVFLDGASNAPIRNVTVRNGVIRNFQYGVCAEYSQNSRFEHLMVSTNTSYGVYYVGQYGMCDGNILSDCTISANGAAGVNYFGNNGGCDGNTMTRCTIIGNSSCGVSLDGSYGGHCDGNTIVDCAIIGNAYYGVYLFGVSGQCDGNTLSGCTVRKNTIRGVWLDNATGNRLEGNHISGQVGATTFGIECTGTARNLILRNTCEGQTNNYNLGSADTYGPIVTASGALATTNGAAGLSPWANFSR